MTSSSTPAFPMPASTEMLRNMELQKIYAYWRAANSLSVGQIYLLDNPLLPEPLTLAHIKPRLLGHWPETAFAGQIVRAPSVRSGARGRPARTPRLGVAALNL